LVPGDITQPGKGPRRDLRETPTPSKAGCVIANLDDIVSNLPPNLAHLNRSQWIEKCDMPGIKTDDRRHGGSPEKTPSPESTHGSC
jgi:hypothetical protein